MELLIELLCLQTGPSYGSFTWSIRIFIEQLTINSGEFFNSTDKFGEFTKSASFDFSLRVVFYGKAMSISARSISVWNAISSKLNALNRDRCTYIFGRDFKVWIVILINEMLHVKFICYEALLWSIKTSSCSCFTNKWNLISQTTITQLTNKVSVKCNELALHVRSER